MSIASLQIGSNIGLHADRLYTKYFKDTPTFHPSTGGLVLETHQAFEKYARKRAAVEPPEFCDEIFSQLTNGLCDTITDLEEQLEQSTSNASDDMLPSTNSVALRPCEDRLLCYISAINMLIEAISR